MAPRSRYDRVGGSESGVLSAHQSLSPEDWSMGGGIPFDHELWAKYERNAPVHKPRTSRGSYSGWYASYPAEHPCREEPAPSDHVSDRYRKTQVKQGGRNDHARNDAKPRPWCAPRFCMIGEWPQNFDPATVAKSQTPPLRM